MASVMVSVLEKELSEAISDEAKEYTKRRILSDSMLVRIMYIMLN
jgi:hypothetical protein